MNALLIAEKPSLLRTIEEVYEKNRSEIPYKMTGLSQRGHLVTLKLPNEIDPEQAKWKWENLPFHPEEHGGWQYKVIKEKKQGNFATAKERLLEIKQELDSGDYDFVIHAGDPDQEGELLVNLVLSALQNKLPVKRFWTNDLTEGAVLNELKNLHDDNDAMRRNLLAAAYGRQHSDYRFGMNLSEAASLKMNARVACGRVKSPMLGIICKREEEIINFRPSTSYGVVAEYADGFTGQYFEPSVNAGKKKDDDEDEDQQSGYIYFDTKQEAADFISGLDKSGTIVSYKKEKKETLPPKLYKLSSIQVDAGKYGIEPNETLEIIQGLYDRQYLSYPRTDCEYLSSHENFQAFLRSVAVIPEFKPYVDQISKADIMRVKKTKKWVNDKELQEAGHSALRPTEKTMTEDVYRNLTEGEKIIYDLICKRFLAAFLPPLVQNKVEIVTDISGKKFKSTGKTLVSLGFMELLGSNVKDKELPAHKNGDSLEVAKFDFAEKTTTCPKKFTQATLIAACEAPHKFLNDQSLKSLGKRLQIGTPATRSDIIKRLIYTDKYLTTSKEGKKEYLVPTELGRAIYRNMKDCDIMKVDLTGEWEEKLEEVRRGNLSLQELEAGMIEHVNHLLEDIKNKEMVKFEGKKYPEVGTCPACGAPMLSGPKGFFCSNYKDGCKMGAFKMICDSMIKDTEFAEMLKGKTIKKEIKKGDKKWPQLLRYDPEQKKVVFVEDVATESSYKCPKCKNVLKINMRVAECESCGFKLWKTVCGKELNDKQLEKILSGGKTLVKGMKSKAGKKFDAYVKLKSDFSGTEFEFPKRD